MYIYKITHKSTHQSYIGQTAELLHRWKQHICGDSSPIQRAISQEGIVAFTFEVIEECKTEEADAREAYWINYYHALTNGYNTNGGIFEQKETSIQPTQDKGKPVLQPQIAKANRGAINSPDGVDAYDPATGELVAHYASIADANRALGKEGTGNISAVCRGRGRTAYGYIWKYTTPQT